MYDILSPSLVHRACKEIEKFKTAEYEGIEFFYISVSRHLAHHMEYHSVECSYRAGLVHKKIQSELQIQLLSKNFN